MATATQTVTVTDRTLLFSQKQKEDVFKSAMGESVKVIVAGEADLKEIEVFGIETNSRVSDLQHQRRVIPSMLILITEREGFLTKYWDFQAKVDRLDAFSAYLSSAIQFVTPEGRTKGDYTRLENNNPVFYAQLKKAEEISQAQVVKLSTASTQIKSLKERVSTFLNVSVGGSIQKFCQIVDLEGKPISVQTRFVDYVTTPVVPKPNPQAIEDARKAEPQKIDLAQSVMPSQVPVSASPPEAAAAAPATVTAPAKESTATVLAQVTALVKAEEENKDAAKPALAEPAGAVGAGRGAKRAKSNGEVKT